MQLHVAAQAMLPVQGGAIDDPIVPPISDHDVGVRREAIDGEGGHGRVHGVLGVSLPDGPARYADPHANVDVGRCLQPLQSEPIERGRQPSSMIGSLKPGTSSRISVVVMNGVMAPW